MEGKVPFPPNFLDDYGEPQLAKDTEVLVLSTVLRAKLMEMLGDALPLDIPYFPVSLYPQE